MTLKEQITEDMKNAMRAKDAERLGTIRMLLAAIKQKEVDEQITVDDVIVVGLVDKLIKQRKDSIAAYEKAARQDLADKEAAEITVGLPQDLAGALGPAEAFAAARLQLGTDAADAPHIGRGEGEAGVVGGDGHEATAAVNEDGEFDFGGATVVEEFIEGSFHSAA